MSTKHHPRKRFGQHFLTDHSILENIVHHVAPEKTDHMIEIGPGLGALTDYLLPHLNYLEVVEFDRDLIKILREKYDAKKLIVHEADALQFTYQTVGNDLRIVGNLPYNISTPLLFKLFSEINHIHDMHFMLQKEVVLRLTAKIHTANYGRLSVMSQYFCDHEYLLTVPPESFDPPPKVESAVVRLTPKKKEKIPEEQFEKFSLVVKAAFNYRRKQLGNSLKKLISAETLLSLNINPQLRAQDISVDEFIRISEKM